MTSSHLQDPALARFRTALTDLYGDRLERAVLFGSRARGDFREDSDYDVAIFLRGFTTRWEELGLLAGLTTDILVDTGADIAPITFRAADYQGDRPILREIRRDGIDL